MIRGNTHKCPVCNEDTLQVVCYKCMFERFIRIVILIESPDEEMTYNPPNKVSELIIEQLHEIEKYKERQE